MKIGFVVHFFDFRNDVRKVINLASQKHEVVLFVRQENAESMKGYINKNISIRIIDEYKNSIFNKILEQSFRFFGKLPQSIKNFYLMEVFKISLLNDNVAQQKAMNLLKLIIKLPKWMSYDYFLSNLRYKKKTYIDDIDKFFCFTDISDDYFFARLIREKKNVKVYVYSWDHPCKQKRYSQQAEYLVWNEGLKQDMVDLQHISPKKIKITGASQFAYVDQYLSLPDKVTNPFPFKYIYFGCAIGAPIIAGKEVELISEISRLLSENNIDVKLVVRPYPVLKDWVLYKKLTALPNVIMDDQYKTKDLSIAEGNIMDKFTRIHFAEAFIHLGTTLGFEACFTDTPSIIVDFDSFKKDKTLLSIYNFVHQYQNEKYLLLKGFPNVVRSAEELSQLLRNILTDKKAYTVYNNAVKSSTSLKSFQQFAADIIAA